MVIARARTLIKQRKNQKGGKRASRNDKKARRLMESRMRSGAKKALANGIDKAWLQKYGDLYRRMFHTRQPGNDVPDPVVYPIQAIEYMREWLSYG